MFQVLLPIHLPIVFSFFLQFPHLGSAAYVIRDGSDGMGQKCIIDVENGSNRME